MTKPIYPIYDSLDPRGKRFVDYFIKSGNGFKSAIKAGFSKTTAINIKHNLLVRDKKKPTRIGLALQEKLKDYQILTNDGALSLIEGVYIDAIENADGKKKYDIRLSGAEKLAKLKGLVGGDNVVIIHNNTSVVDGIIGDIFDEIDKKEEKPLKGGKTFPKISNQSLKTREIPEA